MRQIKTWTVGLVSITAISVVTLLTPRMAANPSHSIPTATTLDVTATTPAVDPSNLSCTDRIERAEVEVLAKQWATQPIPSVLLSPGGIHVSTQEISVDAPFVDPGACQLLVIVGAHLSDDDKARLIAIDPTLIEVTYGEGGRLPLMHQ
ncbi:MAG: hypothetical protein KGR18_08920 [Acidobacteria bacterium]|nr:hypothetical protein [Acidobacteriota bacterium]